MFDEEFDIAQIIALSQKQELTAREKLLLQEWLDADSANRILFSSLSTAHSIQEKMKVFETADSNAIWDNVISKLSQDTPVTPVVRRLWTRIAAAAMGAIIILGIGWFYSREASVKGPVIVQTQRDEIMPGGNKATLTLPDGQLISLSDRKSGVVIDKGRISYSDGDTLAHDVVYTQLITATTPRGGVYEFTLPDGSKVHLNAATVLKFPSTFVRQDSRVVELVHGEAYFEVAKDHSLPFIVKSPKQDIEVLGTHFNISAYPEDGFLLTTLLEGSVKVNNSVVLEPGQQSILKDNKIEVVEADLEAVTAWKKGQFIFDSDNFERTMDMIARWYDIEIIYDYKPVNLHLGGQVSRARSITEVLKKLQETDEVKFAIEGRRVRVIK